MLWSRKWIDTIGEIIRKDSYTTFCKFVKIIEARPRWMNNNKDRARLLLVYRIVKGKYPDNLQDEPP
jgi:hypothetical protein